MSALYKNEDSIFPFKLDLISCKFGKWADFGGLMSNENPFPKSTSDIANLKQTASDAAADLSATASVHASKAKGQLRELSDHSTQEATASLRQAQESLSDVLDSARGYVGSRPLMTIAITLGVGLIIGKIWGSCSSETK
jgi:ElaB/YqjD/DUF883 family membrane-anchored ribosome-binding protein